MHKQTDKKGKFRSRGENILGERRPESMKAFIEDSKDRENNKSMGIGDNREESQIHNNTSVQNHSREFMRKQSTSKPETKEFVSIAFESSLLAD